MPTIHGNGGTSGTSGGRRRGRARAATSLSEINVVPLVDVMLVLLIIFMVAAPMMQRGMDVSLPVSRRSDQLVAERLFVTVSLAFRTERIVQVGDDAVGLEVLADRMRQEIGERGDGDIFVRGDGDITFQELVSVIDELKAGGVDNIGLVTALPSEP